MQLSIKDRKQTLFECVIILSQSKSQQASAGMFLSDYFIVIVDSELLKVIIIVTETLSLQVY